MAQRSPAARKQPDRFPTPAKMAITLDVNGVARKLTVAPWTTLLDALEGATLDEVTFADGKDPARRQARDVDRRRDARG